jgi:hypothetical protein
MAKVTVDVGPAANQTVIVAPAPVNNIGVALASRGGPVLLLAVLTVDNAGAGFNTFTGTIAKNGVAIASTTRTIILIAASRQTVVLHHFDPAGVVGDIYTMRVNVAAVVVPTLLIQDQCNLLVEAMSRDDSTVAGVGAATA